MERETTKLITPLEKHEVVIKTYLTGFEKRQIVNAATPQKVDYNSDAGINGIDLIALMNAGENAVLKNIIVSVDGKTDIDFVEAVLAFRSTDSDYVIAEVKKVADALGEQKKTI